MFKVNKKNVFFKPPLKRIIILENVLLCHNQLTVSFKAVRVGAPPRQSGLWITVLLNS